MPLFSKAQMSAINKVAEKSKSITEPVKKVSAKSINVDLQEMQASVLEYFSDSEAILVSSQEQLHDYVTKAIKAGYVGIDTETTGLDRQNDFIVGSSLYYPGGHECYIPNKHLVPIFDQPYRNQLTYSEVGKELQRFVDSGTKMIFANADFDLSFIYKDFKVDMNSVCYYDVILAWRVLKEDEPKKDLKTLYNKYVLKGKGDPKRFSDFFSVKLFPYCEPNVAKLYAANDAKITYELFKWQLPYLTPEHPKCKKAKLQAISRLFWDVEMPLVKICQNMNRDGIYIDTDVSSVLQKRYAEEQDKESEKLQEMVQEVLDNAQISYSAKKPFKTAKDFNPESPPQVKYLLYDLMKLPQGKNSGTGKEVLHDFNLPITNQILKVRSFNVLINTFVDKMPNSVAKDGNIHAQIKQIGADTGRTSSAEPNLQNIPSKVTDIRHMFRARPQRDYVYDSEELKEENNETLVKFIVPNVYEICLEDGTFVECKELQTGSTIYLTNELNEIKKFCLIEKKLLLNKTDFELVLKEADQN